MTSTMECHDHGTQEETFVCCHLVSAIRTGDNLGFFRAGEPRGDAWCAACEQVRIAEGGVNPVIGTIVRKSSPTSSSCVARVMTRFEPGTGSNPFVQAESTGRGGLI